MAVQAFKKISVIAFALLWAFLSAHCKLETVPGLAFLACAEKSSDAKSNCDDRGCCDFEATARNSDQSDIAGPPAIFTLLILLSPPNLDDRLSGGLPLPSTAPPDLPRSWQFLSRAALPPRAPSFIS